MNRGPDKTPSEVKREHREMKRALRDLSDTVLLFAARVDEAVGPRKDVPRDVSSWLGQAISALEMANDSVRYGALGVDFRRDNKAKAVRKLNQRRIESISTGRALPSSVIP